VRHPNRFSALKVSHLASRVNSAHSADTRLRAPEACLAIASGPPVPGQDGSPANRESLVGPTVSASGRYVAVPKASPNHQISLSANWSSRLVAAVLLMVLKPPKDGEPVGNLLLAKVGHESRNGLGMEKMG